MPDLDPRLAPLSIEPLNAETDLTQHDGVITPNDAFYKRNHFPLPEVDAADWVLTLEGRGRQARALRYDELRSLPNQTFLATMECAGNGRIGFQPPAEGEPWRYGAVSTAEWTGVPLRTVLEMAGPLSGVCEVLIEGLDRGRVPDAGGEIAYTRSLDLDTALRSDVILAYVMNGAVLPPEHGFPVRLIVPGWYGMASVKWVSRIALLSAPFAGFYQADRYVMVLDGREPDALGQMAVRSLFTSPGAGSVLARRRQMVRGVAWSGVGPVRRVEVSVDGGRSWAEARFTSPEARYAWRCWEYTWEPDRSGTWTLQCRAIDGDGRTQPELAAWNRLGYANNAIQSIEVRVD